MLDSSASAGSTAWKKKTRISVTVRKSSSPIKNSSLKLAKLESLCATTRQATLRVGSMPMVQRSQRIDRDEELIIMKVALCKCI